MFRLIGCVVATVLATSMFVASLSAFAADVRVTKSIAVEEEFTDNVDLDPEGEEESSFISTLTPAATVTVDGNRLDLLFAGSLGLQHFSHDNSFEIDQNVRGSATAELWEDWLYLDLDGSSTQQLVDAQSRVSAASSGSGRGGRESVTVLEASPYLAHSFGNWAEGELRYRRTQVYASESEDSTQDFQSLSLDSGTRFTRGQAGLLLEHLNEDVEEDDDDFGLSGQDDDLERYTGQVSGRYAVWRRFALTGVAGYEDIDTDTTRDLTGPFYQFGFDTRPGPRSQFALAIGERYDDLWATGSFHYDITPRLTLDGSVDRFLETTTDRATDRRRDNIIDPITGELVDDDLDEDRRDGVALTWRGDVGLTGFYGRNTLSLRFSYENREFETETETTYQTNFRWDRELSRLWSSQVVAFYRRAETDDTTNTVGARGALDYSIYSNAVLTFGVSHTRRYATLENDEYTESTAFVAGRLQF